MIGQLPNFVRIVVLFLPELQSRLYRQDENDPGESTLSLAPNYTGLRPVHR